jgi:CRISPR/Cas system CMR-associated protein Cmr3 (group 5 of RAMP superfamily)
MPTYSVRIEPIDPLLFGDNRSARAGEDHRLTDQDPSPITFYGAIGGRVASVLGATGERSWSESQASGILGAFSADPDAAQGAERRAQLLGYCLKSASGTLWFPKPLHLRVARKSDGLRVHDLLRPSPREPLGTEPSFLSSIPAGARPLEPGARELLDREDEEELLIDETLLRSILGADESMNGRGIESTSCTPSDLYQGEGRIGLTLGNETNTAVEGRLFSRPYRRFRATLDSGEPAWRCAGFQAWYQVPGSGSHEDWDGIGYLGGDRRRAILSFAACEAAPLAALRSSVIDAAADSLGFLVYLLTPAVAEARRLQFAGRSPVASSIGKPRPASGWRGAAKEPGPRPLVTLVPAGSVFFFDWETVGSSAARRALIESYWLQPVSGTYPCSGLGRALIGVWK